MLTYQDCKELKDGGFPHLSDIEDKYLKGDNMPTLSELIEACGEVHLWGPNQGKGWYADGGANTKQHDSTPEEAVKNLWIALNKK